MVSRIHKDLWLNPEGLWTSSVWMLRWTIVCPKSQWSNQGVKGSHGKESPNFCREVSAFESLVGVVSRWRNRAFWLIGALAGQLQGQEVPAKLCRWDARQYGKAPDGSWWKGSTNYNDVAPQSSIVTNLSDRRSQLIMNGLHFALLDWYIHY